MKPASLTVLCGVLGALVAAWAGSCGLIPLGWFAASVVGALTGLYLRYTCPATSPTPGRVPWPCPHCDREPASTLTGEVAGWVCMTCGATIRNEEWVRYRPPLFTRPTASEPAPEHRTAPDDPTRLAKLQDRLQMLRNGTLS